MGAIGERIAVRQPFRRHRAAAQPGEPHATLGLHAQGAHQPGAELVAGFFADNQKHRKRSAVGGGTVRRAHSGGPVDPGAIPTTNTSASSAAAASAAGSATMTPPARTAMPPSPALRTPASVAG